MAIALALPVLAADVERRIPARLEPGVTHTFEDEISEYEVAVYVIPLRQGQTLQVVLTSNNASNCFESTRRASRNRCTQAATPGATAGWRHQHPATTW